MIHTNQAGSRGIAAVLALLAAATVIIYSNTLSAPFAFDDGHNILENTWIRVTGLSAERLLPLLKSASSRPLANITFALNYYFHGYDVTGYHAVNMLIHMLTGFLMFLVVRHTLGLANHEKKDLTAALAALVWIANPVHTQSVTYIVQRMTSMAALFFMLALYLYIKGRLRQKEGRPGFPVFFIAAGLSGILALLSKQIAATLPVFVLLHEWYFFQNLDTGWIKKQARWIGGTLLIIAVIAAVYLGRAPIDKILAMYDTQNFTMDQRLLTEPRVIFLYLSLIFFPHPSRLNLDYDFPVSTSLVDPVTTIISIAGIIGLAAAAFFTARKYRLVSFAIVWFLGNLAIESSFLGLALVFEHRAYLPSIFVIAALAWAVITYVRPQALAVGILCAATVLWGVWTYQRNAVWADEVALWQDVTAKSPGLARPWNNLGLAFQNRKNMEQALAMYNLSIQKDPGYVNPHNNLGAVYLKMGQPEKALAPLKKALAIEPLFMKPYNNIAIAYHRLSRFDEAVAYCRSGLEKDPDNLDLKNTLGVILKARGKKDEARALFAQVLQADPTHLNALINMALIAGESGEKDRAKNFLEKAVRLNPASDEALYYLGEMLGKAGDNDGAARHLSEAIRLNPDYASAHNALGHVLLHTGQTQKATVHYQKALEADPGMVSARINLAGLMAQAGRIDDALRSFEAIAESRPGDAEVLVKMGMLNQQKQDLPAAIALYEKALALDPGCAVCLNRLGTIHAQAGQLARAAGAFEQLAALVPGNPTVHYNLACLYARQNRTGPAVKSLQKALDTGYKDMDRIRTDKDLGSIRNTPVYKTRIEQQE